MLEGHPLGLHRVLDPPGVLPQVADKLDANFEEIYDNELLLDVSVLNLDSASFREMASRSGGTASVGRCVLETVRSRGKQHNPVTGSGGMLLGTVSAVGPRFPNAELKPGDSVATLVSLTLTPLRIDRIVAEHPEGHQIEIEGQAVLFESGLWTRMPEDLPPEVVLGALDVAGAAPQVDRRALAGQTVVILGAGGKSGLFCAAAARDRVGPSGTVIGIERSSEAARDFTELGAGELLEADATDAVAIYDAVGRVTGGRFADLVVSCVNVQGVEMAAILSAKPRGQVYFFSMATSFTAAALGAEGVGRDVELSIGNGYCEGHAEFTMGLLRKNPPLLRVMRRRCVRGASPRS